MSGIFKYNQNSTPNRRSNYATLFCGSPSQAQDATMDNSFSMAVRSPSMSMLHGGPTSPAQGRSLREYEEQMTTLRKDNFNLKLRIYFLEENMASGNHADASETYFKQNIDLKVEVEALRKDLQEKQDLLCQAAKAMELMEESQKNAEDHNQGIIDELNQKVEMLEMDIKTSEKFHDQSKVRMNQTGLIDFLGTMECRDMDVEQKMKVLELENVIRQFHEQNEEMCKKIEELQIDINDKAERIKSQEKHLNELRYENAEMKEKLEEKDKSMSDLETERLNIKLFECKKDLAEKMCMLDESNDKLKEKTIANDNALKAIQKFLIRIKDLEKEITVLKRNSSTLPHTDNDNITPRIYDESQKPVTQEEYDGIVEKKKILQKKVDDLIQKVCSNSSERNENIIIQQLNDEVISAREEAERAQNWRKECADVCQILTCRLEELAGFLDSLLNNKEFIGSIPTDRRKAIRKAVDRSLDLSRSLNNMSISVTGLSLPENSLYNLSCLSSFLEVDETNLEHNKENQTFNSLEDSVGSQAKIIEKLSAENKALRGELEKSIKKKDNELPKRDKKLASILIEQLSDSEAWSEPDRDVSLARIGLDEKSMATIGGKSMKYNHNVLQEMSSTSENESNVIFFKKPPTASNDIKVLQEQITQMESIIHDRDDKILQIQCNLVDVDNKFKEEKLKMTENLQRSHRELENYKRLNTMLEIEFSQFKEKTNIFDNYNEELNEIIQEKSAEIEKLKIERDQTLVDIRVARMKLETMKSDFEELQQTHKSEMTNLIVKEQQNIEKLRVELKESFAKELRDRETRYEANLVENFVSKSMYHEKIEELKEMHERLEDAHASIMNMNELEANLKRQIYDHEKSIQTMRRHLDESTLQASKAVLERTKALNEKRTIEDVMKLVQDDLDKVKAEKNELNTKLTKLENVNAKLQNQLINTSSSFNNCKMEKQDNNFKFYNHNTKKDGNHSGYTSEELAMHNEEFKGRIENSSPDLGIESDAGRLSNVECKTPRPLLKTLELTKSMSNLLTDTDIEGKSPSSKYLNVSSTLAHEPKHTIHDCEKIEHEHAELKRRYLRTRRALEEAANKIRSANQRKEQFERDIKQQIQKTNIVLKTVRTNMVNELEKNNKTDDS